MWGQGREMDKEQSLWEGTSENSSSTENRTKVLGSRKDTDAGKTRIPHSHSAILFLESLN